MSPFKSAELKVAAEELWGMGVVLSASALASLFRTGELFGLLATAIGISSQILYWKAQVPASAALLEARKAELATLSRQRFDLENRLTAAQQNLPGVLADLARLDPDIARLQDAIRRLDAQIAAREATIRALASQIAELRRSQDSYAPYSTSWLQLEGRIVTAMNQLVAAENYLNSLLNDRRRLQGQLDSLQRTRTDLQRSADDLRAEIANVQRSLSTLATLIAKAEVALSAAGQSLGDAQYQVRLLEQKMRTLGTGP